MAGYIGTQAVSVNTTSATISDDLSVGDNLSLTSDAAVLNIGAGNDLKITHDGTNGTFESAGHLTFDVVGTIVLDADGGYIWFNDNGATIAYFRNENSDLSINVHNQDRDIFFKGNDGGNAITALTLDMSSAGDATFSGNVKLADDRGLVLGASSDFQIFHDPDVNIIQAAVSDQNIRFKVNDGGTVRTCLDLSSSNGGRADFQQSTATAGVNVINSAHDSILQITATASNKNSTIAFGDGADGDVGKIDYDHNNNTMKFVTNAGVRVNILANGTQEINCTAQNVVNSGTGIINLISNGARQAGLGPFIGFRVPNSTGGTTTEDMGAIGFVSPDATDGNRLADFIITTRNTSVGEKFRIAANGQITATDTSISSNSDSRLKKDIVDYAYDWDTFKTYDVKQFNWKQPQFHMGKTNQIGFIAQDLQSVDSQWVGATPLTPTDEDGNAHVEAQYLDADLVSLTSKLGEKDAMYVSIIQQLISKVETLESKVTVLEG